MKTRKAVSLFLAGILSCSSLAGCSSKQASNTANVSSSPSSSAATSAGGSSDELKMPSKNMTIKLWDIATEDPNKKIQEGAVRRFMKAYPNVKVEVTHIQNDTYKQKLVVAMSSGQCPNMYMHWGGGPMNEYIDSGFAVPITDLMNKYCKVKFLKAAIEQCSYKNQIYAVPYGGIGGSGIFYAMCSNLTDPERVVCIFERFCRATDTYNLSDSYIQKCCFKLASSLFYTFMKNSGAEADSRLTCFLNSLVITNGADALELTKQFITRLLDNKDGKVVDEIVEKAKQFILGHLAEDLSLPKIASMLYISPNYLSRLFKKSTGEGFNEYIVRKRIEKAKLLLETTNLKTNRIAMLVGYRDTNYFSLAVKKSVGMSPKNYRDVHQKNAMEHFALG